MNRTSLKSETLGIRELATTLADANDITKSKAKAIVETLRETLVTALKSGKNVSIFGLGSFELRDTKERIGRNPKTGAPVEIPAGRKVKFKASKSIKNRL